MYSWLREDDKRKIYWGVVALAMGAAAATGHPPEQRSSSQKNEGPEDQRSKEPSHTADSDRRIDGRLSQGPR